MAANSPKSDLPQGTLDLWLRVWRRRRMEAELERELRFDEESRIADLVSRGLDPHGDHARRGFGPRGTGERGDS